MRAKRSQTAMMTKSLIVERRWLVSGTPSRALIGVEIELATVEDNMWANSMDDTPVSPEDQSASQDGKSGGTKERRANRDRIALDELGVLVTKFLRVQPWHLSLDDPHCARWNRYYGQSRDESSNLLAPALQRTLEHVFIKHRPEDVKKDITLPPMSNRIVYLEPSVYDRASLNLFALNIISNVILSERTGADYFFDPRNRKQLTKLINNMRHGSFWWCGFKEEGVASTIKISHKYLGRDDVQCSAKDRTRLIGAVQAAESAIALPLWASFQKDQELGCFVSDFPSASRGLWSIDDKTSNPMCIGLTSLLAAQGHIRERLLYPGQFNPPAPDWDLGTYGQLRRQRMSPEPDTPIGFGSGDQDTRLRVNSRLLNARADRADPEKRAKSGRVSDGSVQSRGSKRRPSGRGDRPSDVGRVGGQHDLGHVEETPPTPFDLPADSHLNSTAIVGTPSSKFSYLLDQILRFHQTEKILVFYEADYIVCFILPRRHYIQFG